MARVIGMGEQFCFPAVSVGFGYLEGGGCAVYQWTNFSRLAKKDI
jgi:hypothetical protein